MSVESAKSFLTKMDKDEELQGHVKAAKSAKQIRDLAHEAGFDFTDTDIKSVIDESANFDSQLSDEDLGQVAGGDSISVCGYVVGTAVAAIVGGVSVYFNSSEGKHPSTNCIEPGDPEHPDYKPAGGG